MNKFFSLSLACMLIVLLNSCNNPTFVISEVMANNETTIQASDGKTYSWIEIKNNSSSSASLEGYTLVKDSGSVKYELPDTTIEAGQCIIVYATKTQLKGDLNSGFELNADGDSIQLTKSLGSDSPKASWNNLKADQSLKLVQDWEDKKDDKKAFKKTYKVSPGFPNDEEGREKYLAFMESQRKDPLKIWECANKVISDVNVRWFELKNTSNQAIDLTPYALTDDIDTTKVKLPLRQLGPGQMIVVTDSLKKLKGESYILTKDKAFVDGICCADSYLGTTMGRLQGKNGFFFFQTGTKGQENNVPGYRSITDAPKFETKGGVFAQSSTYLKFKANEGDTIYYTTDGSLPTRSSTIYTDSVKITGTTIVHAMAANGKEMDSPISTATFLMNIKHTLPVFCLTCDTTDLYNWIKGIFVDGPGAAVEFPHTGANYWKDWEKNAHIEFFDGKEGFSYDCGLKIFGAYSRARDKKSFQIKFRSRYGQPKLKYDLYNNGKEEKVKAFVLRSGSQDDNGTMVRDEFFTSLMKAECPTLHVQDYRPVILYINGKYWGVYYIREKINEEFVSHHLGGVDDKSVTLLNGTGTAQIGTNTEYRALLDYVRQHNMTDPTAYNYMKQHIDFASLIDYKIAEFYTGNCDVGNIRFFKSSDKKCDQKWYWLYYDLDWGFYYNTPLRFYIRANCVRASGIRLEPYNVMIDKLLKNPEFRALFLQRWALHRTKTFSVKNATAVFNKIINAIKPEMKQNCERWPKMSYKTWETKVNNFRQKIVNRLPEMDAEIQLELAPTAAERKKYGF